MSKRKSVTPECNHICTLTISKDIVARKFTVNERKVRKDNKPFYCQISHITALINVNSTQVKSASNIIYYDMMFNGMGKERCYFYNPFVKT